MYFEQWGLANIYLTKRSYTKTMEWICMELEI